MATSQLKVQRQLLSNKFGWISDHVPCFGISGNNVHVITEPIDFYETYKVNILIVVNISMRTSKRVICAIE